MVDYAPQIARYFEAFGRERVKVMLFDDLASTPDRLYRECLEFLDVDPSFATTFDVINQSRALRSLWVRDLAFFLERRNPPWPARWLAKSTRRVLAMRLAAWNLKPGPPRPTPRDLRDRLARQYRPSIERLSELLDRDLSTWIDGPSMSRTNFTAT
jgi:hypothetical protein